MCRLLGYCLSAPNPPGYTSLCDAGAGTSQTIFLLCQLQNWSTKEGLISSWLFLSSLLLLFLLLFGCLVVFCGLLWLVFLWWYFIPIVAEECFVFSAATPPFRGLGPILQGSSDVHQQRHQLSIIPLQSSQFCKPFL